jgi:hypothetical protein
MFEAENLLKTTVEETLGELLKYEFNNPEYPENKCLMIKDREIYSKLKNKIISVKRARAHINKILKEICKYIPVEHGAFTDIEMDKFN